MDSKLMTICGTDRTAIILYTTLLVMQYAFKLRTRTKHKILFFTGTVVLSDFLPSHRSAYFELNDKTDSTYIVIIS